MENSLGSDARGFIPNARLRLPICFPCRLESAVRVVPNYCDDSECDGTVLGLPLHQ